MHSASRVSDEEKYGSHPSLSLDAGGGEKDAFFSIQLSAYRVDNYYRQNLKISL
jgi:hypothetical protein